jgi:hypothetical protein
VGKKLLIELIMWIDNTITPIGVLAQKGTKVVFKNGCTAVLQEMPRAKAGYNSLHLHVIDDNGRESVELSHGVTHYKNINVVQS